MTLLQNIEKYKALLVLKFFHILKYRYAYSDTEAIILQKNPKINNHECATKNTLNLNNTFFIKIIIIII